MNTHLISFFRTVVVFLLLLTPAQADVYVVTTLPVLADITSEIGGKHVNVIALAKGAEDPHYVIPRPSLMSPVSRADLFIEIGMGLELWTERVLNGAGNSNCLPGRSGHVYASDGVPRMQVPARLTRAAGDIHPSGNPHVWLNPMNVIIMADNIANGLKAVDPEHADDYDSGAAILSQRIKKHSKQWLQGTASLKGLKLITYHSEWTYLADYLGLDIRNTIEEKPGIPPAAAHRERLLGQIKNESIQYIVLSPFNPRRIPERIAKQARMKIVHLPTDVGGHKDAAGYFSLMETIIRELGRAAGEKE